jgi:hypothetical protein
MTLRAVTPGGRGAATTGSNKVIPSGTSSPTETENEDLKRSQITVKANLAAANEAVLAARKKNQGNHNGALQQANPSVSCCIHYRENTWESWGTETFVLAIPNSCTAELLQRSYNPETKIKL